MELKLMRYSARTASAVFSSLPTRATSSLAFSWLPWAPARRLTFPALAMRRVPPTTSSGWPCPHLLWRMTLLQLLLRPRLSATSALSSTASRSPPDHTFLATQPLRVLQLTHFWSTRTKFLGHHKISPLVEPKSRKCGTTWSLACCFSSCALAKAFGVGYTLLLQSTVQGLRSFMDNFYGNGIRQGVRSGSYITRYG